MISCDDNFMLCFYSIEKAKEGKKMLLSPIACEITSKDEDIRLYTSASQFFKNLKLRMRIRDSQNG
jgi:hypothetical protein